MKENIFSIDCNIDKDFRDKLDNFYCSLLPNLKTIEIVPKGEERDFRGIDTILYLEGNKITVQEKIRRENYQDLLVEFWHSQYSDTDHPELENRKGWYYTTEARLLSYLVPGFIYLIWMKDLREFVENNFKILLERNWKKAYNKEGRYWTYNKIVKWSEIHHKRYSI